MKKERKKADPLSMEKLMACAEVLQAWRKEIDETLKRDYRGRRRDWRNVSLLDFGDGERMLVQAFHCIGALQVSLLDRMETAQMLVRLGEPRK